MKKIIVLLSITGLLYGTLTAQNSGWSRLKGNSANDIHNFNGAYGTKKMSSFINNPYSGKSSVKWRDTKETLWTDGTTGLASAVYFPGCLAGTVSWVDRNGKIWMFGRSDQQFHFYNSLQRLDPCTTSPVRPGLTGTGIYCDGDFVGVGIPETQGDQDYTWLRNGTPVYGPVTGGGSNQSLDFSMDPGYAGTYVVRSAKIGCTDYTFSNEVYVYYAFVNSITIDNVCDNFATFSWANVAPQLPQQLYQIDVIDLNSGNTVYSTQASNITSITIPSLQPSTDYEFDIKTACGLGLQNFGSPNYVYFSTTASRPFGTISPSSATICNGQTQTLTATGGTNYKWYLNGNLLPASIPPSSYPATQQGIYTAEIISGTCRVNAINSSLLTVTPAPAAGTAEWTGEADTNWFNPANWKCNIAPSSSTTVIINGGLSRYPVVTVNTTVKSLVINTGGSCKVNPGVVLTVTE